MTKNKTFTKILEHSNNIDNLFLNLQQKRLYLKEVYENILDENTTIDVITTDTFAFQNNILSIRIDNTKQLYYKISNQIYADYYKIIKYITQYVINYIRISEQQMLDDTTINSVKLVENIEAYKINSNRNVYNIKNAQKIYNYIIDILEILTKNHKKIDEHISTKEKNLNRGINIDNYIENIKHNNALLKNNIDLYYTFLNSHCNYHIKYLLSLYNDVNNLYNNIISEIDFSNINLDKKNIKEVLDISSNIDVSNNLVSKKILVAPDIIKTSQFLPVLKKYIIMFNKYFRLIIKINLYISAIIFSSIFFIYLKK